MAVKEGDILVEHCKSPLHLACAKALMKLFLAEIHDIQDERHTAFEANAKVKRWRSVHPECREIPAGRAS